jgi:glycine/D-amino acid oxidase-like deaminating enzyme
MNRRRFLALGAALGARGTWLTAGEPRPRVVVAGAGIVGASIAYHLARRGAQVTVCEKERPAAGATSKSFAWINSTFSKQPRSYFELNRDGMAAWRRLQGELGGALRVQWGGSVEWYPAGSEADRLRVDLHRHQEWGYAARAADEAELVRLVPGLMPGPVAAGSFSEHEGAVDPAHAVAVLISEAKRFGAGLHHPCAITGLDAKGGRVQRVQTTSGTLETDVLVLAAGIDTPGLAAMAGVAVPLKDAPGVLAHTVPLPSRLGRVTLAPGAHVTQRFSGRVVTGSDFGGSPATVEVAGLGRGLVREAARFLPFLEGTTVEQVTVGFRVMPKDELPIVGFADACPNVYVAAMHSGVTLAPLVGQLAATEILDGAVVESLRPFRLSRFA